MSDDNDYYQNWKNYIEIVEKRTHPIHERTTQYQLAAAENAVGFAQLALKSLLLLNGGALITLPAIKDSFPVDVDPSIILPVAWYYLTSLTLTFIGIVLAYFCQYFQALANQSDGLAEISEIQASEAIVTLKDKERSKECTRAQKICRNTEKGLSKKAFLFEILACLIIFLAFVHFGVGSYNGIGYVLLEAEFKPFYVFLGGGS